MKTVPELNLGSIDAVNYTQRADKEFLSKILHREVFLDEIVSPKRFFVIGEKGTGKTSYATFLQNSDYSNTLSSISTIGATDYNRFINLKKSGKLSISTYHDVWKVILLLLCSDIIASKLKPTAIDFYKFNKLHNAVTSYYDNAFKPEVDYTLELIEHSEAAVKLFKETISAGDKKESKETSSNFQISLHKLQRYFEEAISSLKLSKNLILFIDGIDIRPGLIDFDSYIECIRGLAHAVWSLNTTFFSNIKDSVGRIKIVVLMRPDILDNMEFQNLNGKVRDNGVVLNWQTTFADFGSSQIFRLVSGTLGKQQIPQVLGLEAWKKYFPFRLQNQQVSEKFDDPFVGFLRYSFHRPRDIINTFN